MYNALKTTDILLPREGVDLEKWAVVACDQFTAQPEYWEKARALVGDAPSALNLVLPEAWLGESDARIPAIHAAMDRCLADGTLASAVKDGFVLVERATSAGTRPGLVVALDLDAYDYRPGSQSLIRATEGTVLERVPPRAKVRRNAPLELPHVMMLIDDPADSVIGPLAAKKDALRPLYDFELMLGGGRLRGWAVEGADTQGVFDAIDALLAGADGLLYAVGDGNHSLAAAKQCWEEVARTLTPEQRESHPARLKENGAEAGAGDDLVAFDGAGNEWRFKFAEHPLRLLQAFLDDYMSRHPEAAIDYIHGEDALRGLIARPDALGFMPRAFDKAELFGYIRRFGVLPRKTFSMGEATDKRYYVEARKIV